MKVTSTALPDLLLIESVVHADERGFFTESFNQRVFNQATGLNAQFVQDNHSRSAKNVLRGLHFQSPNPQGKLVRVLRGKVFDVAVDLRKDSNNFGQWAGFELVENDHKQLWIPPGFAHGFLVLSDSADVFYKTTAYYHPLSERCIIWNDADLNIKWPLDSAPILSPRDELGIGFLGSQMDVTARSL